MAKDDYDVIVYRVLVYLYACLKRKTSFDKAAFEAAVKKDVQNDDYFLDALRMMQDEGHISGLVFTKTRGGESILASDISEAKITPSGIHYLNENSQMKKVADALKDAADMIFKLAQLL